MGDDKITTLNMTIAQVTLLCKYDFSSGCLTFKGAITLNNSVSNLLALRLY